MSAISELKDRRNALSAQITEIDAVLRQLGASGPKRNRGTATPGAKRTVTPAVLAGMAKARAARAKKLKAAAQGKAAPKPPVAKPKNKLQAARDRQHPRQSTVPQRPQGASLAAAAEG